MEQEMDARVISDQGVCLQKLDAAISCVDACGWSQNCDRTQRTEKKLIVSSLDTEW